MKKKLAALPSVLAVIASSFAFVSTPKANAILYGSDSGGSATTARGSTPAASQSLLYTHFRRSTGRARRRPQLSPRPARAANHLGIPASPLGLAHRLGSAPARRRPKRATRRPAAGHRGRPRAPRRPRTTRRARRVANTAPDSVALLQRSCPHPSGRARRSAPAPGREGWRRAAQILHPADDLD